MCRVTDPLLLLYCEILGIGRVEGGKLQEDQSDSDRAMRSDEEDSVFSALSALIQMSLESDQNTP
jgi:hypothetical protein